jgi:hypothetical protein
MVTPDEFKRPAVAEARWTEAGRRYVTRHTRLKGIEGIEGIEGMVGLPIGALRDCRIESSSSIPSIMESLDH